MYRKSLVESQGIKGTYVSTYGGIGLAYQYDGKIVRSAGNGFYVPVEVVRFYADNGAGYMAAVRGL